MFQSLCTKGVVLENGCIVYKGNSEQAIKFYLNNAEYTTNSRLLDNIKWKKHTMSISRFELNDTEKTESVITAEQKILHLVIEGEIEENSLIDVMLIFKNQDEVPMASFAEGHCKGKMQVLKQGHFKIERNIQLPKFLSNGDYIIDIYIHHPMVEWFMKAPNCAKIHVDGYQEGYGRALRLKEEGFLGLESIE